MLPSVVRITLYKVVIVVRLNKANGRKEIQEMLVGTPCVERKSTVYPTLLFHHHIWEERGSPRYRKLQRIKGVFLLALSLLFDGIIEDGGREDGRIKKI